MVRTTIYNQLSGAKFGKQAMKERLSPTPGTPRFTARRLENLEDKVSPEEHETYRSGVGALLYLTKYSRPDICNPVMELSKTMDTPAPVHRKEMCWKHTSPFSNVHFRNTTKTQVLDLNFCYFALLLCFSLNLSFSLNYTATETYPK